MKHYTLTLTPQQLEIVVAALGELPAKVTRESLNVIEGQVIKAHAYENAAAAVMTGTDHS